MMGSHDKKMRMIESSIMHNRARECGDKARARSDSALGVHTTRRCSHNRRTWAHATGLYTRSRHFVTT